MVKRMSFWALTPGKDPDKVWKDWLEVHAENFKKLPGIRKYVINRVIKVIGGETKFWGSVELWFDSEADLNRAFSTPRPVDHFGDNQTEPKFAAIVEERVIVPFAEEKKT